MYKYKYTDVFKFAGDEVICRIETDSSIMLTVDNKQYKATVEIEADEAREIAKKLIEMADKLDVELLKD